MSPIADLVVVQDGLVMSARSYLSDEQTMRDVGQIDPSHGGLVLWPVKSSAPTTAAGVPSMRLDSAECSAPVCPKSLPSG